MKTRLALTVVAAALIASGCGTETGSANGRILAYGYQPGMDLTYDMHQEISMEMETSGAAAMLMGAADMSMAMIFDQRVGYAFDEGPDPDSVAIRMVFDIVEASATVTTGGQTEFMSMDDFGADVVTPPIELVLDAQGNVIEVSLGGESLPTEYLDLMSGMGSPDMMQQPHMGPVFPDYPVGVGDAWTVDMSQQIFGMEINQEARFRAVAEEVVGGVSALRVEGTITTGAIEVNLADMMGELAGSGFGDADLDVSAEMFESLGIDMSYRTDRSEVDMTSWFDPIGGVVVKAETDGLMRMSIEMSGIPDLGGDITMDVLMDMAQSIELIP